MTTTRTDVSIYGPNLRNPSKGTFEVHRRGCAHTKRFAPWEHGWDIPAEYAETRWDVVYDIYGDIMTDDPEFYSTPEGQATVYNDVYFAPCLKDLPEGEPDTEEET